VLISDRFNYLNLYLQKILLLAILLTYCGNIALDAINNIGALHLLPELTKPAG